MANDGTIRGNPEYLPALTVWQPFAALLVHSIKRYETRSWKTNYRGLVALHAAKKPVTEVLVQLPDMQVRYIRGKLYEDLEDLPCGMVLATARLVACYEITRDFVKYLPRGEDKLGDFTLGRFAWEFTGITPLLEPVEVSGHQGLWRWKCPW